MNPESGFIGEVRERVELLSAGYRGAKPVGEIIAQALFELGYENAQRPTMAKEDAIHVQAEMIL